MEPGGIEPPSQSSQQDASTRVVDVLSLGIVPAIDSLHFRPASKNLLARLSGCTPVVPA